MHVRDHGFQNCKWKLLDFFDNTNSAGVLNLIINICQKIIYDEPNERAAREKFIKVLYNLSKSNALKTFIEEDYEKVLHILLTDILGIYREVNNYYVGNKEFDRLGLYELQDIFIEAKRKISCS